MVPFGKSHEKIIPVSYILVKCYGRIPTIVMNTFGGCMNKRIAIGLILLSLGFSVFAGDAAVFVDNGFSKNGNVYVFGQYGKTDKTFEAYAEIFTIDIAKNAFVSGEVYKTAPSAATAGRSGKEEYETLKGKHYFQLEKYACAETSSDNLLYISDDAKSGNEEIVFEDFAKSTIDNPVFYHIHLIQTAFGSGNKKSASFFISIKKTAADGSELAAYTVGAPQIKRDGVVSYKIDRILRDNSGKSLVFIVEKTMKDSTGTCIRYMAETVKL